jgi:ComF family protein
MRAQVLGRLLPGYWFYHTFWTAVDWVYPPVCGGCQKFGVRWCVECQSKVQKLTTVCPRCGSFEPRGFLCLHCRTNPPPYTSRSWGRYAGPLREAIHQLKYRNNIGLAEALSQHLIELFHSTGWSVDEITVVPLSPKRMMDRGYNQSSLLAKPLALACHIPFQPKILSRVRETISQVGLSASNRHVNVRNAFLADAHQVHDKVILIIDDVTTTGATLTECSRALLNAGARQVYSLTLAKSILSEDEQNVPQN